MPSGINTRTWNEHIVTRCLDAVGCAGLTIRFHRVSSGGALPRLPRRLLGFDETWGGGGGGHAGPERRQQPRGESVADRPQVGPALLVECIAGELASYVDDP